MFGAQQLSAQGAANSHPTQAQPPTLEEIVVTAQKREERLQTVPISVTAMTAAALESRSVVSVHQLTEVVPGLVAINQLNSFSPIIRGIGQSNLAPGADLGVATYVDGVYQSSPTGANLGLGAIERVEVLRGPQGTLFGRNATGGVVSIVTADPSRNFDGYVSAAVSDPLAWEGKLYVTGPVTQSVAASFAVVATDQEDGYGRNVVTGTDTFVRDEYSYRGKILVDLSEATTLRLSADYNKMTSDVGISRTHMPGSLRLDGQPNPGGFWDTRNYLDPRAKIEQWGGSAVLDHDFGALHSKTIVSYRSVDSYFKLDQAWVNAPILFFDNSLYDRTVTVETQLLSGSSSTFEWIGGLFYLHTDTGVDPTIAITPQSGFTTVSDLSVDSIAGFGQMTFHLDPSSRLTLGARWTQDEKKMKSRTSVSPIRTNRNESWSEPTWRISIDRRLTDTFLAYASYNRGFKSGVYNTFDYPLAINPSVDPEFVDAYEIGWKADALSGRFRINGAIYYNKYDGIQLSSVQTGGAILTNAAEATTYGAELELAFAATDNLTINGNLAYTDAEYDKFPNAPAFVANTGQCSPRTNPVNCRIAMDAKGNRFSGIPEFTYNLGLSYERQVPIGAVGFNLNYFWADERVWGFDERFKTSSYGLVSGDIFTHFGEGENNEIRLFGRNLTNEKYATNVVAFALNNLLDPAPGRTVGVQYRRRF